MNAGPVSWETSTQRATHARSPAPPFIGVTSPTDLQLHYREVGPRHVAHGGTTKNTSGKSLSATSLDSSTLPTQSQQQNALNQN